MTLYLQPEFYGGKYAKEIAYSIAKERKVGRYVKIYPVSFESKKPKSGGSPCTKVEIYGAPYLRKYLNLTDQPKIPNAPGDDDVSIVLHFLYELYINGYYSYHYIV